MGQSHNKEERQSTTTHHTPPSYKHDATTGTRCWPKGERRRYDERIRHLGRVLYDCCCSSVDDVDDVSKRLIEESFISTNPDLIFRTVGGMDDIDELMKKGAFASGSRLSCSAKCEVWVGALRVTGEEADKASSLPSSPDRQSSSSQEADQLHQQDQQQKHRQQQQQFFEATRELIGHCLIAQIRNVTERFYALPSPSCEGGGGPTTKKDAVARLAVLLEQIVSQWESYVHAVRRRFPDACGEKTARCQRREVDEGDDDDNDATLLNVFLLPEHRRLLDEVLLKDLIVSMQGDYRVLLLSGRALQLLPSPAACIAVMSDVYLHSPFVGRHQQGPSLAALSANVSLSSSVRRYTIEKEMFQKNLEWTVYPIWTEVRFLRNGDSVDSSSTIQDPRGRKAFEALACGDYQTLRSMMHGQIRRGEGGDSASAVATADCNSVSSSSLLLSITASSPQAPSPFILTGVRYLRNVLSFHLSTWNYLRSGRAVPPQVASRFDHLGAALPQTPALPTTTTATASSSSSSTAGKVAENCYRLPMPKPAHVLDAIFYHLRGPTACASPSSSYLCAQALLDNHELSTRIETIRKQLARGMNRNPRPHPHLVEVVTSCVDHYLALDRLFVLQRLRKWQRRRRVAGHGEQEKEEDAATTTRTKQEEDQGKGRMSTMRINSDCQHLVMAFLYPKVGPKGFFRRLRIPTVMHEKYIMEDGRSTAAADATA